MTDVLRLTPETAGLLMLALGVLGMVDPRAGFFIVGLAGFLGALGKIVVTS